MAKTTKNPTRTTARSAPRHALVDAGGTAHARAGKKARIVSLVPSVTELLFALGLGQNVVGRTAFCVHPADGLAAVTSVGGTKKVNVNRLLGLDPTHVIVNVDENPKALADDLAERGLDMVVTHPIAVEDNVSLYRLIGGVFGAETAAEDLVARFEAALDAARAAARDLPARNVLYLIWKEPWMTVSADTYISRLLAVANWKTVAPGGGDDPATRYPELELSDECLERDDLVLMSSEPYAFSAADAADFAAAFPAHGDKVRLVDGQKLSWYGSRAIDGLAYLTDLAQAEAKK